MSCLALEQSGTARAPNVYGNPRLEVFCLVMRAPQSACTRVRAGPANREVFVADLFIDAYACAWLCSYLDMISIKMRKQVRNFNTGCWATPP